MSGLNGSNICIFNKNRKIGGSKVIIETRINKSKINLILSFVYCFNV